MTKKTFKLYDVGVWLRNWLHCIMTHDIHYPTKGDKTSN